MRLHIAQRRRRRTLFRRTPPPGASVTGTAARPQGRRRLRRRQRQDLRGAKPPGRGHGPDRAAASPVAVRSRMRSRSNSAKAAKMWKMSLPPGGGVDRPPAGCGTRCRLSQVDDGVAPCQRRLLFYICAGQRLGNRQSCSGGHPLRVAVGDQPAAAVGVLMLEGAIDHVGDRLEPTVRVPGGPLEPE
jgi:hypothetical protein